MRRSPPNGRHYAQHWRYRGIGADVRASRAAPYPPDSGALNVRDFGAKGNGRDDDTKALLAAIAAAGSDTGAFFWRTRSSTCPPAPTWSRARW